MTMRSACLILALGALCVALLCEVQAFKMPAKPFETGGLIAFVASFCVGAS